MIIIYCFPWFLRVMNFKSGSTGGCDSRSHEVLVRHQVYSHLKAEWLTCTAASWGRASVPSTWVTSQGGLGALKATNAVHWVLLLDWLPLPPWEPGHGRYSRLGLTWMDSVWPLPFSLPASDTVWGGYVSLAEAGHLSTQWTYSKGGWERG